jgi:hypothetical protein
MITTKAPWDSGSPQPTMRQFNIKKRKKKKKKPCDSSGVSSYFLLKMNHPVPFPNALILGAKTSAETQAKGY